MAGGNFHGQQRERSSRQLTINNEQKFQHILSYLLHNQEAKEPAKTAKKKLTECRVSGADAEPTRRRCGSRSSGGGGISCRDAFPGEHTPVDCAGGASAHDSRTTHKRRHDTSSPLARTRRQRCRWRFACGSNSCNYHSLLLLRWRQIRNKKTEWYVHYVLPVYMFFLRDLRLIPREQNKGPRRGSKRPG